MLHPHGAACLRPPARGAALPALLWICIASPPPDLLDERESVRRCPWNSPLRRPRVTNPFECTAAESKDRSPASPRCACLHKVVLII